MNDSLSRRDQLQLEAYRSLNLWNDHDGKILLTFDTVMLAFVAAMLFAEDRFNTMPWWAFVVGIVVVVMWFLLALRTYNRMKERYVLMRAIEGKLGFRAHIAIFSIIESSRFLQKIRFLTFRCVIALIMVGTMVWKILVNLQ